MLLWVCKETCIRMLTNLNMVEGVVAVGEWSDVHPWENVQGKFSGRHVEDFKVVSSHK